jgi:hypothetical protein
VNQRCPDCCSEEVVPSDRPGADLTCGNCGALFGNGQALVTVADAEAYAEDCVACTCNDVRYAGALDLLDGHHVEARDDLGDAD